MLRVVKIHKQIWGVRARFSDPLLTTSDGSLHQWEDRTPRPGASATAQRLQSHRNSRAAIRRLADFLGLQGVLQSDPKWGFLSLKLISGELVCVSLAHTEDAVCAVLSTSPVGIDIENQNRSVDKLASRLFTEQESSWAKSLGVAPIDVWCAKESVLKALGTGIAGGLKKVSLRPVSYKKDFYEAAVSLAAPLKIQAPCVQLEKWGPFVVSVCGERQVLESGVHWLASD